MKLSIAQTLPFLILTPYILGSSPADSSFDEYSFGVGGGQYASYDCAGVAHPNSFGDAGVKFTHKFEGPFRIGLAVSGISANGNSGGIPYPDLALDYKYFSVGTTGVRVGSEDGTYGEISVFDQVPFFSGRGCFRMGVGFKPTESTRLWLGVNTFPYMKNGIAGQFDFLVSNNQFLFINGRGGQSGSVSEYGFSIGTRIKVR